MTKSVFRKLPGATRVERRPAGRPAATEAARRIDNLLDTAAEIFIENGYEGTSVGEIAKRARASKHTLYSRYPTKAELFTAVINRRSEGGFARLTRVLQAEEPIEQVLKSYAAELLLPFVDQKLLRLLRTIISTAAKFPEVGRSFWTIGPERAHQILSDLLRNRMAKGELSEADPVQAAHLFLAMCSGRYWFRQLADIPPRLPRSEFAAYSHQVVEAFLTIYGPA